MDAEVEIIENPVGNWEKLLLRCAYSHQRLSDPARGGTCRHVPRCNYDVLRSHCVTKACPVQGCQAVITRIGSIERDESLAAALAQLPVHADFAWVRCLEGEWEVQCGERSAGRPAPQPAVRLAQRPARHHPAVMPVAPVRGGLKQTPREIIKCTKDTGVEDPEQLRAQIACSSGVKIEPLLLEVACAGLRRYTSLLIELKANPNFRSAQGTPLVLASHNAHVGVARDLIEAGAEVNRKSLDGDTPLLRACAEEGCTTEMIQLLIQSGADVSITDKHGCNPLIRAFKNDLVTPVVASLLIEYGVNLLSVDEKGYGAVHWLLELHERDDCPIGPEQTKRIRALLKIVLSKAPQTASIECEAGGTPLAWLLLFVPGCGAPDDQWGNYERIEDVEELARVLIEDGHADAAASSRMYKEDQGQVRAQLDYYEGCGIHSPKQLAEHLGVRLPVVEDGTPEPAAA
eukprot:5195228-Prymnesium_polylepis.1